MAFANDFTKLNLNTLIQFVPTDFLLVEMERHMKTIQDELPKSYKRKTMAEFYHIDEHGIAEMHLWDFMTSFGKMMFNGVELLVEDNSLFIKSKDLT